MFKRTIQPLLEDALKRSPIVLLTGARQTGKTTLVKEIGAHHNYHYITFDDIRFLSAAQSDPAGFIAGLPKPVILDEVQRVPEIFLPLKKDIDENRVPGRYLLTGSANPLMIPRLGDAFVGRMEIFTLYPLSQGELLGKKEQFIEHLLKQEIPMVQRNPIIRPELLEKIIIGGYPSVQNASAQARESWINSYINTLLQRDVQDLAQISGLSEFPQLLRLLATRTSNLLNVAELSRSSTIAISTLHRYLTLLEALFIISLITPWHANLSKRLVKAPKTSFIDTGILTFLLGIDQERLLNNSMLVGGILENFVISELKKQISWSTHRINLFHFRTQTGIEVDAVLETSAGAVIGIEIKASDTVTPSDFKGLKYLQEETGKNFIAGIVLYTGSESIPFGKNLYALSINSLWQ
jgi:predicted AAA+ superfamily ATPase